MKRIPAPSTLVEAQDWLSGLILAGRGALGENLDEAAVRLSGRSREDCEARLGAYVAGYPARIREALAETYPAVCNLVGEHGFAELAARYAPLAPSGEYSLDASAAGFEDFLRGDALSGSLPFLGDLARLERLALRAFHATDLPAADLSVTASWQLSDWAGAVLEFQPSLAVVESTWPIHDLWVARDTERDEIDIVVEGRPQSVIVFRFGAYDSLGVAVRCEPVLPGCATALGLLVEGRSLGEVMSILAEAGEDPEPVTEWFSGWAAAGLVTAIR